MNRLLIRILSGMIFALIAAMAVMTVIFNLFYGRLFTYPKWYPIRHTAELVQYIIDKTPQEKINREIDYLSVVLNRQIDVVSINDAAVPGSVKQELSNGLVKYGKSKDRKKIFYAPVQQGKHVVLIDPSFQQYKPVFDLCSFIINAIILFITAAFVGFWLVYPINRRLNNIEAAEERISQGDITVRIHNQSTDLIGNVERCFNQMADRIRTLVTNRRDLLGAIVQRFQIPIAKIDGYLKGLRRGSDVQEIKKRSEQIDETINDIELLVSDLLTQEKVIMSGCRDQGNDPQRDTIPDRLSYGVQETHQGKEPHTATVAHSSLKIGVMKFVLRISLGILIVLLIHQALMLVRSQLVYEYTNKDPAWHPVHSMANLIQRAVELTPQEELVDWLKAFEASLDRRLELVPAKEATRHYTRTSVLEFMDGMTYGVFNGRDVYSAPVHNGADILMIDPAFGRFRQHPSIIYHTIILTIQFILTAFFGILLSMPIIRNLKRLMVGIERIRQDDLDARVDIPLNQPIGTLAGHLNDMAERIRSLLNHQRHLIQAVVHEIRTPVSRIRFHLEMLSDAKDRIEIDKRVADIKEEIEELNRLVMELSTFTSLDSMKEFPATENVPLYNTIREIMAYHQKTNNYINIVLLNDADKEINVTADPVYFKRAIHNILFNALRHAREQVSLRWAEVKDGISLEICDDGPGIPESAREEVFEPFTRLDHSRNRRSGGFGLGLAIVKRIISLHGGSISIADNTPGGAKVITWWPSSNYHQRNPLSIKLDTN
ncbi:MAG: HAMP domain-containing protein [Deltaproteobacteria bacterium]|nr:HAMP domain-containing protein [Deltaproteobacteria bacterium]